MLKPEQPGLSQSQFKEIKRRLLEEGEFDPNYYEEMNTFQKYWVNETKKTLREYFK